MCGEHRGRGHQGQFQRQRHFVIGTCVDAERARCTNAPEIGLPSPLRVDARQIKTLPIGPHSRQRDPIDRMKFLFFLLVVIIGAVAGYFCHPLIYSMMENARPKTTVVVVKQQEPDPAKSATGTKTHDPSAVAALQERLKGAAGAQPTEPSTTDSSSSNPSTAAADEDEFAKKYPLPNFKAITEITKDWTYMPSRAFPRKVKSKIDVDFQAGSGKTTSPKGSELVAMGMAEGMLIVGRSEQDSLKAQIPLVATDLKETMEDLYAKYQEKTKARILALREKARYERDHPAPPPPPEDERVKLAGTKPTTDGEGKVPEMVSSIQAKEVSEFKLSQIMSWGPVDFQMDGTKGFWACTITVKMNTLFGEVDTEVTALMTGGKVTKWFYSGSKEPVQ